MNKKWYVFINSAEDSGTFILNLDESELRGVDKLIKNQRNFVYSENTGGYFGRIMRDSKEYETREEAIKAATDSENIISIYRKYLFGEE